MRRANAASSARLRRRLQAFYEIHDPPRAANQRSLEHTLEQCEHDESKLGRILDAMYNAQLEPDSHARQSVVRFEPKVAEEEDLAGKRNALSNRPQLKQPMKGSELEDALAFEDEGVSETDQIDQEEDETEMVDHEEHKKEVREHAEMEVHSDGRLYFDAEQMHIDKQDPFASLFKVVEQVQERALPLLLGVLLSIILANVSPDTYLQYFGKASHSYASNSTSRLLSADVHVYELSSCDMWGHSFTLHFVANDIIMVFHFAVAMKEITEALLPGGSLNPPWKAMNPIICTIGGIVGPIAVYFALLQTMVATGAFEENSMSELRKGWGIVTATDVSLAWPLALLVFGHGHPAIDFLLLLAVAAEALGMVIIVVAYPDAAKPVDPKWLVLVILAMFLCWCLRKWHFRKIRITHQSWIPYVLVGFMSWVGFLWAHLHPALALMPIVPFMPGPTYEELENFDEGVETAMENLALGRERKMVNDRRLKKQRSINGKLVKRAPRASLRIGGDSARPEPLHSAHAEWSIHGMKRKRRESDILSHSLEDILEEAHQPGRLRSQSVESQAKALALMHQHDRARGRGVTIQAGMYAGLAGHHVEESLMVYEYDDDGHLIRHVSTLDEFAQFIAIYVDFGLFLFAMCNAGVEVTGRGFRPMTVLILTSLWVGKFVGIVVFYELAHALGYPAPLGVRRKHIVMIGLIAGVGLTVALFVSELAFVDGSQLQADARLGAVLTPLIGILCWGMSRYFDFSHEDVVHEEQVQLEEEVHHEEDIITHQVERERRRSESHDLDQIP